MRIWFIHHYAQPPDAAGGTRHFSLGERLAAAGHSVWIATSSYHYLTQRETRNFASGFEERESVRGVEFVWIRSVTHRGNSVTRVFNMISFAYRAMRSRTLRESGRPDVVLGSSPQPFAALAAWRLSRRHGARFVYEVRDLWPDTLVELGRIPRWHPLVAVFAAIERLCLRKADAVITLLPSSAARLSAKGADPSRIAWIPNGVDFGAVGPTNSPPTRAFCDFIYAGAIGFANGLDVAIRAAAAVDRTPGAPPVRLRIVGDGPERSNLQSLVTELGATNVQFFPPVGKDEVYNLLRSSDCCVMILRDSPVFRWGISPNKLFDYLASARPVLFAVRSPNDPVSEAGAGLRADPDSVDAVADAMVRLASLSPDERRMIGLKGRAYAEEHHDLDRLAVRFSEVLLGNGPPVA